ncbi:MAG: hypothetical protein QM642_10325 [Edaphocola sp.]
MSSCSKKGDYTCVCSITVSGTTTTQSITIKDQKKKKAKEACEEAGAAYTAQGITASCALQ